MPLAGNRATSNGGNGCNGTWTVLPDICLPPTEHGVRAAMGQVVAACQSLIGDDLADLLGAVEIAVTEALNNVVEHARPQTDITVRVGMRQARLAVCITDQGIALPGSAIPRHRTHDLTGPLDSLPEGGFGWSLIHDLTAAVRYRRQTGENQLRLEFDLPR